MTDHDRSHSPYGLSHIPNSGWNEWHGFVFSALLADEALG
jgi:hypothetical protein